VPPVQQVFAFLAGGPEIAANLSPTIGHEELPRETLRSKVGEGSICLLMVGFGRALPRASGLSAITGRHNAHVGDGVLYVAKRTTCAGEC
jgi:hypothetical protein